MLHLHRQLESMAKQELIRLDISGSVLGVSFVYHKCCPMLRITFSSEIEPKLTLTGYDYIEKDNDDNTTWYLYLTIDTNIRII